MQQLLKKTAARAFILMEGMKNLRIVFSRVFRFYVYSTAVLATLLGGYIIAEHYLIAIIPSDISVKLNDNFVYKKHYLYYINGKRVLDGNVVKLQVHGNFVYGYYDPDYPLYRYFICESWKNCNKTRDYNDVEFKIALRKLGLPNFYGEDHSSLIEHEFIKRIFHGEIR